MSDVDTAMIMRSLDHVDAKVQSIQVALPPLAQALTVIGSQVLEIDGEVKSLLTRQDELQREFHEYLADYRRRTELQLAETRIVKIRQELEVRFGHLAEVRRRTTGILQATDLSIVRQETIRTTAEELMLGAPRYWLAPAIVALMCWIVDEREIAERALTEGLRRDRFKLSLFLTLLCRRAGRWEAMNRWLGLYLKLIDPFEVDREVVVVLDAVTMGALGRKAQGVLWQAAVGWSRALSQVPGQLEDQARRWVEVLAGEKGEVERNEFVLLRSHSSTWPHLENSLSGVRRNRRVLARFERVLVSPIDSQAPVAEAIDDLLDGLVGRFDDEELPLRRQERLLQLIIDGEGDRERAEEKMRIEEEAFAEKVSFAARLTDALMHPEQAGASRAAQRFAVAFCRDWILAAQTFLGQRDERDVPLDVELSFEGWRGRSRDGMNRREVTESLESHFAERRRRALAAIKLPVYAWLSPVIGLIVGGAVRGVGWAFFAVGLLLLVLGKWRQEQDRKRQAARLATELAEALAAAEGCLVELATYRRSWTEAKREADDVESLLRSIAVDDDAPVDREEASAEDREREPARPAGQGFQGARLAESLAAWDLVPAAG